MVCSRSSGVKGLAAGAAGVGAGAVGAAAAPVADVVVLSDAMIKIKNDNRMSCRE